MTTIAVTGATGHVGGRVAALLADRLSSTSAAGTLRLVVRDPSRAPRLPGVEVRTASYGDAAAAERALAGADVLFMVSAAESANRRAEHRTFVDAARRAGVGHLVYTSFVGAAPDAGFTLGRDHHDTEQAIAESGLIATVLRDNFYADLLPYFAGDDGIIRGPAGAGRVAAVARADVADAVVAVLSDPAAHAGATYQLTGPEAMTLTEVAERASAVLGRPLRFIGETVEEAYASRSVSWPGTPRWQLDAWVSTYTAIRDGEVAAVSDDVPRVTGHPARTLEQSLRR